MSEFSVHVLGCASAKPNVRHNPSCTVVDYRNNLYMIDCGEGAQKEMQRQHLKMNRLNHIFLTHLHGDHVLGLPGLVSTLALTRKSGGLTIHTTAEGARMFQTIFDFFNSDTEFEVRFNILDPHKEQIALETNTLRVTTIPLKHRVPCMGFIFEEKEKQRHIRPDMIEFFNVPKVQIRAIKNGADFITPDGQVIANERLTLPPTPSYSYAHIGDTLFMPALGERLRGVTLLYHESTYLKQNRAEAVQRFHSTAEQAALVALKAEAKSLLIGHYSSRYRDDNLFLEEAKKIYPNTVLADEGVKIEVDKL